MTKAQIEYAERIANEISCTTTDNAHIAEDRGLDCGARDEESKYSTVQRTNGPQLSTESNTTELFKLTPCGYDSDAEIAI